MDNIVKLTDSLKKDLSNYIDAYTKNIVLKDFTAEEIYSNKGAIKGISMAISLLNFVNSWAKSNPHSYTIPNSFLKVTPENDENGQIIFHRISVDTGLINSVDNSSSLSTSESVQ